MKKFSKAIKKGFTLVELVVVIAIIAILAAVSVGGYFIYIAQAQQAELTTMKAEVITLVKSFTVAKTYNDVTLTYGTNGLTAMKGAVAAPAEEATKALKAVIDENHSASEKDANEGFVAVYTLGTTEAVNALNAGIKDGIVSDTAIVKSALTTNATKIVRGICAVMETKTVGEITETTSTVKSVWYVSSYEQAISIVL